MLPDDYIIHGLNALARASETNYFTDGHRGAAILSAYFLCREERLDPGVPELIGGMMNKYWINTSLCAPFPDEVADPALIAKLADTVCAHATGLRQAGHNIIFPSLALKGFRHKPEAVTPSRVAGICRLVESFDKVDAIELDEEDEQPPLTPVPELATFLLRRLLHVMEAFDGRGQGWSGHLLTTGRAVIDLNECGHADLAEACLPGLWHYVKRIRMGPRETDKGRPEHAVSELRPHHRAYWEARASNDPTLGHVLKYPYGFYGLLRHCGVAELTARCMRETWRIF